MSNTEIMQIKGWRARACAFIKIKIINSQDRILALQAVEKIKMPLHLAMGSTPDELKNKFIKKVISAVTTALNTDKYSTVIASMQL